MTLQGTNGGIYMTTPSTHGQLVADKPAEHELTTPSIVTNGRPT